jgi:plastocyanin
MRISGAFAVVFMTLACGGGDGPTNGGNNSGPVASVQISAASGEMEVDQTRQLSVTLRNASNAVLTGRVVAWSVNPAGILSLSSTSGSQITVEADAEGTATVTATSEGKSDTEVITVNEPGALPSEADVNLLAATFNPPTVSIALDGSVTWTNNSGVAHTLEFDNPPEAKTDVPAFANGQEHTRVFGTAGTYNYHCSIHPTTMTGSVTVVAP